MKKNLHQFSHAIYMGLLSILTAQSVMASGVTGTTRATATLGTACTLLAQDINFGALTLAAGTTRTWKTGNLSILCSNKTSYTVKMSYHTPDPTDAQNMGLLTGAQSGDTISYGIFQAQTPTNPTWEYTAMNSSGTGATQNFTMYGEIIMNRYPTVDTYSDTVTVNLSY